MTKDAFQPYGSVAVSRAIDALIANGQTASGAVRTSQFRVGSFQVPPTFTGATVTIECANELRQQDAITVGGVWVAGEKVTLTIGDNNLVLTVGTTTTTAAVAGNIVKAVNNTALDAGYSATRTSGWDAIGLTATISGSVATITGPDGVAYTLTPTTDSVAGTLVKATDTSKWTAPEVEGNEDNPVTVTGGGTYRIPAAAFYSKYVRLRSASAEGAERRLAVFLKM
jgi:hypothetical protein